MRMILVFPNMFSHLKIFHPDIGPKVADIAAWLMNKRM